MKILYINALYSPYVAGGAELSLKLIAEGMQHRGHEVVVLSLHPDQGWTTDEVDGVKVYRVGLKNRYWPFGQQRPGKLQRLAWHAKDRYNAAMKRFVHEVVGREQPDVVSCHNLVGWSVSAWDEVAAAHVPIVQVLHDLYLLCPNSDMFKNDKPCEQQCLSCKILRYGHRSGSQQVDAVVGISKHTLNRFISAGYFAHSHQQVIRNAREIPDQRSKAKRNPGTPLRIGYLGTLAQKKGVEWLIEQFEALDIAATLQIAGKGQTVYENELKMRVRDPRITFAGYVNSQDFFDTIDVLVVPSIWHEPLGMVAVEALANHVPVIASRVGGLQETLQPEVNGLFCDYGMPDSLGQAISRIALEDGLYDRLSAFARQSIEPLLSTDRMVGEYEGLLQRLVRKNKQN